jgi:hypothetical protein
LLARDGHVRIDGFLDRTLLEWARPLVDTAVRRPTEPGCERPNNRLIPLRWDDELVSLVLDDDGRRRQVAAACDARELRWISGYLSVKSPWEGALGWHQDWWCWHHPVSFRPEPAQVALLIYLSDTDRSRGALRVLPGSHRRAAPLHRVLADRAVYEDQPEQVTLEAAAGDAVVLDYRLLHGAHPNSCADRRDALLLSFAPAWALLPEDIRGHLIQHTALPSQGEKPHAGWQTELLPSFDGPRADLPLSRTAPAAGR